MAAKQKTVTEKLYGFVASVDFRRIVCARVDKLHELLEMRAAPDSWTAAQYYDREIIMFYIHLHRVLRKVTNAGAEIKMIPAAFMKQFPDTCIEFIKHDLDFIKGAVNDPWLFAMAEKKNQKAAVMGLHKARITVEKRVKDLLSKAV